MWPKCFINMYVSLYLFFNLIYVNSYHYILKSKKIFNDNCNVDDSQKECMQCSSTSRPSLLVVSMVNDLTKFELQIIVLPGAAFIFFNWKYPDTKLTKQLDLLIVSWETIVDACSVGQYADIFWFLLHICGILQVQWCLKSSFRILYNLVQKHHCSERMFSFARVAQNCTKPLIYALIL